MNKILLLLIYALPVAGYSQKLKKVRDYNEKTGVTEIYYVLQSDGSTKQGSYKKIGTDDELLQTGYYNNGLKDSIWIEYDRISKHIFSRAHYENDTVTGICEYYDQHGELAQKYDYTNHRLVYNKPQSGFFLLDNSGPRRPEFYADSANQSGNQDAIYIGGEWAIVSKLIRYTIYPPHARLNGIEGRVIISFVVDTHGKAKEYKIIKGVDPELDREALRVCKMIPNQWIPGKKNGVTVESQVFLPVQFKLQ